MGLNRGLRRKPVAGIFIALKTTPDCVFTHIIGNLFNVF
jgi:hypothetical protein